MFLFYYRDNEHLYRTLSCGVSGVSSHHQPHHGWLWFVFPHSFSTTTSPSPPWVDTNHLDSTAQVPLPLLRGVGPVISPPKPLEQPWRHCPSPFQRDVGGLGSLDNNDGSHLEQWQRVPQKMTMTDSDSNDNKNNVRRQQRWSVVKWRWWGGGKTQTREGKRRTRGTHYETRAMIGHGSFSTSIGWHRGRDTMTMTGESRGWDEMTQRKGKPGRGCGQRREDSRDEGDGGDEEGEEDQRKQCRGGRKWWRRWRGQGGGTTRRMEMTRRKGSRQGRQDKGETRQGRYKTRERWNEGEMTCMEGRTMEQSPIFLFLCIYMYLGPSADT